MRPACSTTNSRARSPGARLQVDRVDAGRRDHATGGERRRARHRRARGAGCAAGGGGRRRRSGRRRSRRPAAGRTHAGADARSGDAASDARPQVRPRGLGEDPERADEQMGEVAEEGRRPLLVDVVADELEDPAEDEQARATPSRAASGPTPARTAETASITSGQRGVEGQVVEGHRERARPRPASP